ncbi:MAG: Crp/Fnr family transcriptional regulator [Tissierella sp.]|uniref:Crp/Fnr family transcriptional regulator n=1 Tax=Tissierella sp. TaxID=41274 RepID=UPI003F9451F6
MKKHLKSLSKCILFKDIEEVKIEEILNSMTYNISTYEKDSIIAIEGDDCNSLGIILEGNIEIHKSFPSGKVVTINHFSAGNIFGEALVFSGTHVYPATILSSSTSKIMYLKRDTITKLMTIDERIINNFMGVLSNRILMLNDRISNLSLDTLRKKISNIILKQYKKQKSLKIILPYSRKKMAQLLNIPRPSLSRELINMQDEELINFNKNNITILNLKKIEESLL